MSDIAVIVDSSGALSDEIRQQAGIFQVNVPIIFGTTTIKENEGIRTVAELTAKIEQDGVMPTTASPAPGDWEVQLDAAKAAGYTQALLLTISSGFSGGFQAATIAAQTYEGMNQVQAWDSKVTTLGLGWQALFAAKLAQNGADLETITQRLAEIRDQMQVRFVVNDISHLQRTGRVSAGAALIGGLLNIKPILAIDVDGEGKISAIGKARKMSGALKDVKTALADSLAQYDLPLRAAVIDGNNAALADKWQEELAAEFPDITFERGVLTPYIGVHTGDGAMGVLWTVDWEKLV
jgi:DegV family protein with EDD domain